MVILVSTSQIGGLFGHDDCREMVPLRIPNPDSLGSRNKEVSLLVDFDPVGDTVKKEIFLSHVRQDDRFTFCRLTVCTTGHYAVLRSHELTTGRAFPQIPIPFSLTLFKKPHS